MKQSYSTRTLLQRFDTILAANNNAISDLNMTANSISAAKSPTADIYEQLMQEFVTTILTPFSTGTLLQVGTVYASHYSALSMQNVKHQAAIDDLVAGYGPVEAIPAQLKKMSADNSALKAQQMQLKAQHDRLADQLRGVAEFDQRAHKAGKVDLSLNNISYFDSKKGIDGFFARIFDGHYKQGRKLIATFAKTGQSIPVVKTEYVATSDALSKLNKDIATADKSYNNLSEVPKALSDLSAQMKSEKQMSDILKAKIISDARHKDQFDNLLRNFPTQVPEYLVETRAKIDAYDKLEASAKTQAKQLKDMAAPIEKKMPDLRKAARSSQSRNVSLDMDKIETAFGDAQKNAKKNAEQVKKGKEKVTNYDRRYDASTMSRDVAVSALDAYTDILMYDMLFDMMDGKLDGHGGLFNGGLDLGDALSSVGSDLSNTFNTVSFDTSDIAETLSKIEMPDVSGLMDGVGDVFGNIADGAGDFFSGFDL